MSYRLILTKAALKDLASLDPYVQKRIQRYFNSHVQGSANPRAHGKALSANLAGFWRYRIGGYRAVCVIHDDVCEVVAIKIGHRSKVYS